MARTAARKTRRKATREKCMIPECDKVAFVRGVCQACYRSALNYIDRGMATEKELIDKGLILPGKQRGARSPFSAALKKAREA